MSADISAAGWVAAEYEHERGLLGRRAAYDHSTGPDPREVAIRAVVEVAPRRVLEVGCGPGELAARIAELGADVTAIDISPRMVELARSRGVAAEVGDVQDLARFPDESFDCAVAAWMLYHVADVELALRELARVLRPGGRLVAVTNDPDHLLELRELVGASLPAATFRGDVAAGVLRRSFARVERREAAGWIEFPDREAVARYVESAASFWSRPLPADFDGPLSVRRAPVVFVAETAR